MRKPKAALKPKPIDAEVSASQIWNQEREKIRNQPKEQESSQDKLQRLVPGFDLKRLVL